MADNKSPRPQDDHRHRAAREGGRGRGAAIKAGAPAATVVFGRGQGMRERLGPLGVAIQPEKEIILVILEEGSPSRC